MRHKLIALGLSLLGLLAAAAPAAAVQTPIPTTGAAAQVTSSAALLNGTVLPGGTSSVSYRFAYGTSATSLAQTTTLTAGGSGTTPRAVTAAITSLTPGTTYYFQLVIRFNRTNYLGAVQSFTTQPPPQIPVVTTKPATQLTPVSAILAGTVNPAGPQTVSYDFAYGSSASALDHTTAPASAGSGTAATPVSAAVSGLNPGTTYYFRLDTSFNGHIYSGAVNSLTTPQIPAVSTGAASAVTPGGATVGGTINPSGPQTLSYRFAYGTSPAALAHTTSLVRGPSGSAPAEVSAGLSGLAPDTTYYYRLDVTLSGQTFSGPTQSFTTTIPPPDPASRSPSWITNTAATLGGLVNPTGFATSYHFDWGATAAYGHSTPALSAGAGSDEIPVSFTVAGLVPGATYHFRVVAQSPGGTVYGDDQQFTTGSALLAPPRFAFHVRPRLRIAAVARSGLTARFSCSTGCTAHFAVSLAPGAARGVRLPMNLAQRKVELQSGGSGTATIELPGNLRRRLGGRRVLKLVVSAYATGNQTRRTPPQLAPLSLVRR